MTNMSIQPLWLTHFIEILLVLEFQLTKFIVGTFSYKAHFRPQISSNDLLNLPLRFSRNVAPPYFTTIQDNRVDNNFKEELIFIPHDQIGLFTVIFKTKISFPPSINTFLNAIVPIELVMNINSDIPV